MSKDDRNPFGYSDEERGASDPASILRDAAVRAGHDVDEAASMPSPRVDIEMVATFTMPDEAVREMKAAQDALFEEVRETVEQLKRSEERTNRLGRHAMEWLKGCSHAPTDPRECEGCTAAFLEAVHAEGNPWGGVDRGVDEPLKLGGGGPLTSAGLAAVAAKMAAQHGWGEVTVDTPRMERTVGGGRSWMWWNDPAARANMAPPIDEPHVSANPEPRHRIAMHLSGTLTRAQIDRIHEALSFDMGVTEIDDFDIAYDPPLDSRD